MNAKEKTQMWAMFAAHATSGFLSAHINHTEQMPDVEDVSGYASELADNLLRIAEILEHGIEELEKNRLPRK